MIDINTLKFNHKRVLIRVDFNVPLDTNGKITDNTRIKAALPTINYVLENGGSVVLMSHLGRPKNGPDKKFSLRPVAKELERLIKKEVIFLPDCISEESIQKTRNINPGVIVLLENLRFYPEEKKGDVQFAKILSQHGDFYINDAFGTAHRAHASTSVIAQFFPKERCAGFLLAKEIENLNRLMLSPVSPTLAIIGGAKVSSKIEIIEKLIEIVDNIIIGGGMAYTFVKALGGEIGDSLVESDYQPTALSVLKKAKAKNVQFYLPIDTVIADQFANTATIQTVSIDAIPKNWMGLDIGDKSIASFSKVIQQAQTILWNGPMGVFEMEKFSDGTKAIAHALVKATENGAYSLIGGGDSVAAINQLNLSEKVSYVSTGGGAMLEYLEGKALPGIKAIME